MLISEYVKEFKNLKCSTCGTANLMMMGDKEKVDGVFCRSCLEFEKISIEDIQIKIHKMIEDRLDKKIKPGGGMVDTRAQDGPR